MKDSEDRTDNIIPMIRWKKYDPQWLIELVKQQIPERSEIVAALEKCTRCFEESEAYIYFVDSANANEPGSQWQFQKNIVLESPEGEIVLDLLKDGRIGGVEFVGKIEW